MLAIVRGLLVTLAVVGSAVAAEAQKATSDRHGNGADPVRSGLIASLARPGGNVTGMTVLGPELEAKRLGHLKRALPAMSRIAVLWNSANPAIKPYYQAAEAAAQALHVTVDPGVEVRRIEEFDAAFSVISRARPDALVVLPDRSLLAHRKRIIEFASARRLPAIYAYPEYVEAGDLMAYAPNYVTLYREAAAYVDKILEGARPGDLPVQEPSDFLLAVNLRTARALGLTLSPSLVMQASLVID